MRALSPRARKLGRSTAAGSRAESVYARLREAINTGQLPPGRRVRELEVAEWLGVSRTPVREALHRLESEEMIVKSERGLIIPLIADEQIAELYAMREVLEGAAAALAAQHASPTHIQLLEQILADSAAAVDGAAGQNAALNKQFHAAIHRAANNRYLLKSLNAMQEAIERLPQTTFSWPGRPRKALREHRTILRAIGQRDAATAETAARTHIREALRYRMMLVHEARRATRDIRE